MSRASGRAPKRLACIEDAKKRFDETGDFRFVALAIGESPGNPPVWAMLACIAEFQRDRRAPIIGNDPERLGPRLDAMIRFFIEAEDEFERRVRESGEKTESGETKSVLFDYTPPPVAQAIRYALEQCGVIPEGYEAAAKQLLRAWNAEIREGPFASCKYLKLHGMPAQTDRMLRVIERWCDEHYMDGKPLSEMSRVVYLDRVFKED